MHRPPASAARSACGILAFVFVLGLIGAPASAWAEIFVVTNLDDQAPGACLPDDCTLRAAVAAANAVAGHSEIHFAPGLTGTIELYDVPEFYNFMEVTAPLTVVGPGADLLTIDALDASRFFSVTSATADFSISGITLANGNTVGLGGAIHSTARLSLDRVVISDAYSARHGGCINVVGADLRVTNSTLSGCEAVDHGGGIALANGSVTLGNSTISGNQAPFGGGIKVDAGNAVIANSTIAGNSASSGGGLNVLGTLTLENSIVAGNIGTVSSPELVAATLEARNSLVEGASTPLVDGNVSGNITGQDPLLSPLQDNGGPTPTHGLRLGSPAIDAGDNSLLPGGTDFDQRGSGFARIVNDTVDMGAFESVVGVTGPDFTVTTVDDPGDGVCSADDCSLREAVAAANADSDASTIGFAPGVSGTIALHDFGGGLGFMTVTAPLTVIGPGADLLTIDAGDASRAFQVTESAAVFNLSGMTIVNTDSFGIGGGPLIGGAILSAVSTLLEGVVIHASYGLWGGCIAMQQEADLTLMDTTLTGCRSILAGGGIRSDGDVTILASTISGAVAEEGDGGGIHVTGADLVLTNSTLSGNEAGEFNGGGFHVSTGNATVRNSTISGNKADGSGGGFMVFRGTAIVENSIVANNSRGFPDDFSYAEFEVYDEGSMLQIRNSLVEGSSDPAVGGGGPNGNITGQDPLLGLLQYNGGPTPTHALLPGSPAIDAGNNSLLPIDLDFDQRGPGFPRIVDGTVDMGAVESPILIFRNDFEQPPPP